MKKLIQAVVLSSTLLLTGCASLDWLNPFSKPSVEANVQLGKENTSEKNQIKLETGNSEQKAEKISNDTSYKADVVNQIANELTWWQLVAIIILAGVALPSWRELGVGIKTISIEGYKGLKYVLTDVFKLVIIPITGVKNFILELFGKKNVQS